MLAGSNNTDLSRKYPNLDSKVIPFFQIWKELVNPQTLDIYQYRVLTSYSALVELTSVIEKTQSGLFTTDANIEACRSETLYILNQDKVLANHHKPLLNRLRSCLGKKASTAAEKNRLLAHIRYAVHILSPTYLRTVLYELKSSIQAGDIEHIECYANTAASQAINNGWSPRALSELLRFFTQDGDFESQWELFQSRLVDSSDYPHDVLINIPFAQLNGEAQAQALDALNRLGLNPKSHAEIVAEYPEIRDIAELLKAEKRYFRVSVYAKDVYSASHIAVSKLATVLNMASFYNLVNAWDLKSVVIVAINKTSSYHRSFTAESLYATYDYLDSSGRIFECTRRIFTDDSKGALRDKLQGAFSYTNISRASLFQEEKYMNLWVALESLARTDMYSDIISNVRESVPAAVCIRYIYRIVRNFIEDCKRCHVRLDFGNVVIDTEQPTKQRMVTEAISVFRDTALFPILQRKCSINSLLEYRCLQVHKLLTDIKFTHEKVQNHYNRVSWQIQRLYRIRNEIAHSALQEKTSLIVYIEHLNDYLSSYISEIVTCITEKGFNSLEEALCLIKNNCDVFFDFCKNHDTAAFEETVFATGIISLI